MSLPIHRLPIHSLAAPGPQDLQPLVGTLTLRRGRVHEFCGPSRMMLAALVMARSAGPVIWARPSWGSDRINPAGLERLADPGRLLLVAGKREEMMLWAAEEALRSGAAPLVVAELLTPPGLTPIRRLQLAAEAGGEAAACAGTVAPVGLILVPGQGGAPGVESRWHMCPASSRSLLWSQQEAWRLTRLRARLAPTAAWHFNRAADATETLEPLTPEGV